MHHEDYAMASRDVPKIVQLVTETKAELLRLGIDIAGKRPEEILRMAHDERNKPRASRSTLKPRPE